jgi:peroxin-19
LVYFVFLNLFLILSPLHLYRNFYIAFVANDPNNPNQIEAADRTVAATMQMMSQAAVGMEGFEAGKMEEAGDQMMEDMMAQFEALGDKEDYNEVVDNVMRQLLSKDLMYEPTKMVCEKFPKWLAIHKHHLTEAEYTNYGKMYQVFQNLLAVYDIEPDNFPRLMELMYDMQQYGQPPAEIIKELAPGLKFDENGMPIMPNMGAGVLPENFPMPGGEGLPNMQEMAGQMGSGQCSIM